MKILLRATNWVGDVVMSLPALTALRASFPKDTITVLARPWVAELYRLRAEVNDVLVEEPGNRGRQKLIATVKGRRFDRAIILPTSFSSAFTLYRAGIPERFGYRGEGRSLFLTHPVRLKLAPGEHGEHGGHQVWEHLRLVEAAGARLDGPPDVSFVPGDRQREAGKKRLEEAGWGGSPYVAAHAASYAHQAKRWDLARYAELFERLHEWLGVTVALLGSAAEAAINAELAGRITTAPVVNLSGKTSLPEVLGILAQAKVFVGNDSGLAHLAGAAGAATVVVFGSTDPDATRPWDGPRADGRKMRIRIARRRPLCAPCRFRVCPIDHTCMTGLTVEDVMKQIEAALN